MKFYNYVYERGGKVEMKAIAAPQTKFKSPLDVFESSYLARTSTAGDRTKQSSGIHSGGR